MGYQHLGAIALRAFDPQAALVTEIVMTMMFLVIILGATAFTLFNQGDELMAGSTTVGWDEIAIGFVVSQDSDVRAMTRIGDRLVLWENIEVQLAFKVENRYLLGHEPVLPLPASQSNAA